MKAMIDNLYHYLSSLFTKGATIFALCFTVFCELFTKYIFNDWQFVGFLFVLIIVDTFFGTWKAIKIGGWRALSFKEAEKFLVKVFLYFGVLVLSHVLGAFTVHGEKNNLYSWIDTVLYGYIITKEALSALKNINSISPTYVPAFIIRRLDSFMNSGKISDLTKDEKEA